MKPATYPPRVLSASASGQVAVLSHRDWEAFVGLTPEMSFATDVLMDAKMLDEKRIRLLQAAERDGGSPVDLARKLVRLNGVLRSARSARSAHQ